MGNYTYPDKARYYHCGAHFHAFRRQCNCSTTKNLSKARPPWNNAKSMPHYTLFLARRRMDDVGQFLPDLIEWRGNHPCSVHAECSVYAKLTLMNFNLPPRPSDHPATFKMSPKWLKEVLRWKITRLPDTAVILMNFLIKDSSRHMADLYFASDLLLLNTLFHSSDVGR